MAGAFSRTMNLPHTDNLKIDKNEFCQHPPKTFQFQQEYIARANVTKAKNATFQAVMRMSLLIGQCFGLCPVSGVSSNDCSKLRFSFWSGRSIYTMLSIVGQFSLVGMCALRLIHDSNISVMSNTSLVFYGSNTLTTVLFFRIAMKWPKLCQYIAKVEAADSDLEYSLIRNCNLVCIIILSLATLEHVLSDLSGIALAIDCQPDTELYQAFILQGFPWVWSFFTYNPVLGFMIQILNIQTTFNWNFADVFVICVSLYLTSQFNKINQRLCTIKGKFVPSSFWRTMREDYTRTTNLVRRIDDVISGVVFISFANNLFFICVQLLNTLEEGIQVTPACNRFPDERPFRGYEQAAYFVYSFAFLMARSLAVSLIAARVHTASRAPTQALYEVPSSAFCIEVQRFLDQIHGDTVALSGLNFFNVKRGLVLTIAGTIVTYELVLMQFAGVSPTASPSPATYKPASRTTFAP